MPATTSLWDPTANESVGVYFSVRIDDIAGLLDLGAFISCDGLGMDVDIESRPSGGDNDFEWKVPGRLRYRNIKLKRPIGPDTRKVALWFQSLAVGVLPTTGRIAALTPQGAEVIAWNLIGIVPVSWDGPSFSAESLAIATETLELAHHGFIVE